MKNIFCWTATPIISGHAGWGQWELGGLTATGGGHMFSIPELDTRAKVVFVLEIRRLLHLTVVLPGEEWVAEG